MPTLQIRNVPDHVSQTLKARAAAAGQSLSEYALAELTRSVASPTIDELWARISAREPIEPGPGNTAADILRAERDAR